MALQGFDNGWADVDLIQPFDALHPAWAFSVDLDYLAADHIDAHEVQAVGHQLGAHRFDDAAFYVTDLQRDRASARADVGPRIVTHGHSAEGGQLPVALQDLALEQENPCIAVLPAVDELLNDRIAVLQHRLRHLRKVRFVLVLDHEHVATLGPVQRLDDTMAHLADEPLDRFRVTGHQ